MKARLLLPIHTLSIHPRWVLVFACSVLLAVLPAAALDLTVTRFDDPRPNGCMVGNCSLREAIIDANAAAGADTITLAAGVYTLAIPGSGEDLAAKGDLDVTGDLVLNGAGRDVTIIQGNGAITGDRVFHLLDPLGAGIAVTFRELSVIGGSVLNESGGGILISSAEGMVPPVSVTEAESAVTLNLEGCIVRDNVADSNMIDPVTLKPVGGSGGGIYNEGALVAANTTVHTNQAAANGGGIYAGGPVDCIVCSIRGNTAEGGGGLFETGNHISAYREGNIHANAAVGGGGVSVRGMVTLQLTNLTLDANTATDVGAGMQSNGTVNLFNCTVTGNESASDSPYGGAGLNSFASGTFRLWNTVMAGNRVAVLGTPAVRNCGCTGGTCTPLVQFLSQANNAEDADTCDLTGASDLVNTDPKLAGMGYYGGPTGAREPHATSPLVDAGDDATCPVLDQALRTRPKDGDNDGTARCDIGAIEMWSPTFLDGFESGDVTAWSTVG